jgi:hypothetical protein
MASWETWFEGVFSFIRSKGVKAFCYIGCDWEKIPMFAGQGWGDARVQADPVVRRNWEKEINGKEFIHAGEGLFRQLGFRKA